MNTMAPTRPTALQSRRVWLATGPAAVPEARGHVRAAICSWEVPVDLDSAVLLASELVTNAIRHETGAAVMLVIACSGSHLRVDVHDTSHSLPVAADLPADAETGRGLLLVATLSAEWGFYRTPAGKAVFFTLAFEPGRAPAAGEREPAGDPGAGTASRNLSHGSPSPRTSPAIPAVRSTRLDDAGPVPGRDPSGLQPRSSARLVTWEDLRSQALTG